MKKLNQLIIDESFQRWLSDTASSTEKNRWDKWLKQSSHNQILHQEAVKLWDTGKFQPTQYPNIENEWQRLRTRIKVSENRHKIYSFESDFGYGWRHKRKMSFRFIGTAIAASIFIAFVYQFVSHQYSKRTPPGIDLQYVATEYGQRATVKLSDGTRIILNANSTLGYPAVLNEGADRNVQLKGEAYFHVTKKPQGLQKKFIVNTTEGQIKVLGTKFVIYERGNGARVVVAEGSVEISPLRDQIKKHRVDVKTLLKSGQLLYFHKDSKNLIPEEVNIHPYITWWQKHLILDKTPFREVVKRIEETYGVEVKVTDDTLLERTLSGSVENQNLVVLTDALAYALKVHVVRDGKTVIFGKSKE